MIDTLNDLNALNDLKISHEEFSNIMKKNAYENMKNMSQEKSTTLQKSF